MKEKTVAAKAAPAGDGLLAIVDRWLGKYSRVLLGVCLALTALFCYLLFDAKLSFMTDDAEYVVRTWNFIHLGNYPSYQGPLYPLALSVLMSLFGIRLTIFKVFSAICLLGQVFFFYRAFRSRIPSLVTFFLLLLVSINAFFLYYGSYTFNEAFLMCVQAAGFMVFLRHLQKLEGENTVATPWASWLLFGLFLFLLSITKNLLIVGVGAAVLYFLLYRQWKNAGLTIVSFLVFKLPYELFTRLVFHQQTTSQLDQVMRKDFYDASKGYEDFSGYMDRFFTNFDHFLSVNFLKVLNLRAVDAEASGFLTLLLTALMVWAGIYLFRRNRYAFFALLYGFIVLAVSCVALQTIWADQERLVIPYIPYLLAGILTAAYLFVSEKKTGALRPVLLGILAIILFVQLPDTMKKTGKNSRALHKYLKGDNTFGYAPEVQDFLEMAKWIGQNVSDSAVIATGKPSEAFIYARGKHFIRIDKPTQDMPADTVLAHLKKSKVTHLLYDQTHFGASVPMSLQIIETKYPEKLLLVHQIGEGEYGTYLLKIAY